MGSIVAEQVVFLVYIVLRMGLTNHRYTPLLCSKFPFSEQMHILREDGVNVCSGPEPA